jgi:hypothetical protein
MQSTPSTYLQAADTVAGFPVVGAVGVVVVVPGRTLTLYAGVIAVPLASFRTICMV